MLLTVFDEAQGGSLLQRDVHGQVLDAEVEPTDALVVLNALGFELTCHLLELGNVGSVLANSARVPAHSKTTG